MQYSITHSPFLCLLWINLYSNPLPIFQFSYLCGFLCCWVGRFLCLLWKHISYQICDLWTFSPILLVVALFSWYVWQQKRKVLILKKYNWSISSFVMCAFVLTSKKILPNSRSQSFRPILHWVYHPFCVNLCIWLEPEVQLHSFACSYPAVPAPFVQRTILSPIKLSWYCSNL